MSGTPWFTSRVSVDRMTTRRLEVLEFKPCQYFCWGQSYKTTPYMVYQSTKPVTCVMGNWLTRPQFVENSQKTALIFWNYYRAYMFNWFSSLVSRVISTLWHVCLLYFVYKTYLWKQIALPKWKIWLTIMVLYDYAQNKKQRYYWVFNFNCNLSGLLIAEHFFE